MSNSLLLAVHISNGVLSPPWIWLGFTGMVLLLIPAMTRIADEEIPRIALLTAAFFLASSIHVKLGPTSVHLLLNGLVGVVLGWRAGLAIPIGLTLQAFLLEHGGLSTIGINSCVLTIPALLCAGLVTMVRSPVRGLRADLYWLLAFLTPILLVNLLLYFLMTFALNRWSIPRPPYFFWIWQIILLIPALPTGLLLQPLFLQWFLGLKKMSHFTLGCLVGAIGVSLSLVLQSGVILYGGEADWNVIVQIVLTSYLPVLVLESLIVGFTLQFLARVKPDLIHFSPDPAHSNQSPERQSAGNNAPEPIEEPRFPLNPLALVSLLFFTPEVMAHRLDADYRILPDRQIRIEAWFDSGSKPETGKVQVFLPDNQLLTEGSLGAKGLFQFRIEKPITLRVVVNPGDGHRKELTISESILSKAFTKNGNAEGPTGENGLQSSSESPSREYTPTEGFPLRDTMLGTGFLLALASFWLSWRNQQGIQRLEKKLQILSIRQDPLNNLPPD